MAEKQNTKWIKIGFAVNFCMTLTCLYLVGILFWVGLYRFNPVGQSSASSAQCAQPAAGVPVTGSTQAAGQGAISISNTGFSPKVISKKAGSSPTIAIVNNGALTHSFVIDELNVNSGDIVAGQSKDIQLGVLPNVAKNYAFYSNVAGDDSASFSGVLSVVQ